MRAIGGWLTLLLIDEGLEELVVATELELGRAELVVVLELE
jgi:hypothetical protein